MMQALPAAEAKALICEIVKSGTVRYAIRHAADSMRKRNMTRVDCSNVLKIGQVREAEWENGRWRYQVFTNRMLVVVELLRADMLLVVTCWRTR